MKKGISLIVLVITIIVMIILAAAVVISLNSTNLIDKANTATASMNEKQIQHAASLLWAEAYMDGIKTQEGLNEVVVEGLKEIVGENNLVNYDVTVSETGVIVTKKDTVTDTTAKLAGTWVLNSTITMPTTAISETGLKYTSNNESFEGIEVGTSSLVYTYSTETASINKHNFVLTATHVGAPGDEDAGDDSSSTTGTVEAYINGWTNTAYCTVDFGTTAQTVSKDFYNWLVANATQQTTVISGIWVFKSTIVMPTTAISETGLKYTSNNESFEGIEVGTTSLVYTYSTEMALSRPSSNTKYDFVLTATHVGAPGDEDAGDDSSSTTGTVEAYINGWTNIAYCTVDFGTTDQEVSMAFYNWLNANATINS